MSAVRTNNYNSDRYLIITFTLLCLTVFGNNVGSSETEVKIVKCPLICKCDLFENLRRATCTNRSIVSIETNVPKEVEMLDLSYNVIPKIPENIFLELELNSLKWLNLSRNSIREIHLRAFAGLYTLEVLDLSYNHLQYLVQDWFWENNNLKELKLRKNMFVTFKPGPLLDSTSLNILDLSYGSIRFFPEDAFSKLPNLTALDLRGNYLSEIATNLIEPLGALETLMLKNNSLKCNSNKYTTFKKYCIDKDIKLDQKCSSSKSDKDKEEKFQRMVVPDDVNGKNEQEDEEETSWKITVKPEQNDSCSCQLTITPTTVSNASLPLNDRIHGYMRKIYDLSPSLVSLFMVSLGFLLGLILGCSCQCRSKQSNAADSDTSSIKRRRRRSSIIRKNPQESWEDIEILLHPKNNQGLSTSTPVMNTRRARISSSYY